MRGLVVNAGLYLWHTLVCVAILAWVVTAFWGVSYALSIHRRLEADRLLQQLKALPPGAPALERAQQIAHRFGGTKHCSGDSCSFDFATGFAFRSRSWSLPFWRTEWDSVGLRPWRVAATIEVRNKEVALTVVQVLVGRGRGWLYNNGLLSGNYWGWLMVSVSDSPERFNDAVRFEKELVRKDGIKTGQQIEPGADGIIVRKPSLMIEGGGDELDITLSSLAAPGSKAAGFDINLRCATAMVPCTELCQLAPSAWRSYSQFQRSHGWWADEPADCGIR